MRPNSRSGRAVLLLCSLFLMLSASWAGSTFRGNTKSRVFHSAFCQHYNCKNCTAEFATAREATAAGYRPCSICNPSTAVDSSRIVRSAEAVYIGNSSSRVLHRSSCRHANCKNCTIRFSSRDDAIRAGYKPGGCCNP